MAGHYYWWPAKVPDGEEITAYDAVPEEIYVPYVLSLSMTLNIDQLLNYTLGEAINITHTHYTILSETASIGILLR